MRSVFAYLLLMVLGPLACAQYAGGSHSGYASAATVLAEPTGLEGMAEGEEIFALSPSPAEETATAYATQAGTLTLIDLQGRTALRRELPAGKTPVSFGGLPAGLYIVAFADERGAVLHRSKILLRFH